MWIAFDHVARVKDALSQHPDDFVAFPAPAGPKGRGWMPVVAGLAVAKGAPDAPDAVKLIDYLTTPAMQVSTTKAVASSGGSCHAAGRSGPRAAADRGRHRPMSAAPDSLVSQLPVGLDQRGGEFDKVFMDTFQRVVLRGEAPRAALDREAEVMAHIMADTKAPCWAPDPASNGPCQVK